MKIQISSKKISQVLFILFILNIVMLFGTWLHNSGILTGVPNGLLRLVAQLNLAAENVAAAWFSSMLLLLVAVAAGCSYLADNQRLPKLKDRILNLGWIVFVLIFLLLSFDEMGSFHEMIGESAAFKALGDGSSGGGWYVFYVVVGLAGIFMMLFFLLKFLRNKVALLFAVLGVLLFLSNPIQENYEIASFRNAPDPATWKRPMLFLLLEEGSELFGSFFLFLSFTTYLKSSLAKSIQNGKSKDFSVAIPGNNLVPVYIVMVFLITGLLMMIVRWNSWNISDPDSGIPQNWFPSSISFIVSLAAFYLFYFSRKVLKQNGFIYLFIAVFSLLTSLIFGSNIYSYKDGFFRMLDIFLFVGSVLTGILAGLKLKVLWSKVAILVWLLLIIVSFFTTDFSSTAFEYWAFSSLFLALVFDYRDILGKRLTASI